MNEITAEDFGLPEQLTIFDDIRPLFDNAWGPSTILMSEELWNDILEYSRISGRR